MTTRASPPVSHELLAFHYMLGSAISAWAQIEFNLAFMVGLLTQHHVPEQREKFQKLDSASRKLSLADEVVRSHKDFAENGLGWDALHTRLERLVKIRNELAHHTVVFYQEGHIGHRVRLLNPKKPMHNALAKQGRGTNYVMAARDQFYEAAFEVTAFTDRMSGGQLKFGATSTQSRRPATLAAALLEIEGFWRPGGGDVNRSC